MIRRSPTVANARAALAAAEFAGVFVFAAAGAMTAIAANLDLLGVLILGFATALGGGIIRDVLIGAVPPVAIKDWRYAIVAFTGGTAAIAVHRFVPATPGPVLVALDAAGLGLFAVAGANKALGHGVHPFMAVLMGTITGAGGGTVRDMLLAKVPAILRTDIYAVAAMAGAAVFVAGMRLGMRSSVASVFGGAACFALRVVAVWRHWNLPTFAHP